jgi:hypothetical protein
MLGADQARWLVGAAAGSRALEDHRVRSTDRPCDRRRSQRRARRRLQVRFQWAPDPGKANLAPWDGLQSFGTIDVTRDALTIARWGIDGHERYRTELPRA